jgi:hypothetical protein
VNADGVASLEDWYLAQLARLEIGDDAHKGKWGSGTRAGSSRMLAEGGATVVRAPGARLVAAPLGDACMVS